MQSSFLELHKVNARQEAVDKLLTDKDKLQKQLEKVVSETKSIVLHSKVHDFSNLSNSKFSFSSLEQILTSLSSAF